MEKLKDYLMQKGIYFGCAVNTKLLNLDAHYSDFIRDQYNIVTPENSMKFWAVHSEEGSYDFSQADNLISYAQKNNLLVRGHTLIFHKNTPDWVKAYSDKEKLFKIFSDHIQTVTSHFREKVYCWDVVNEAFDSQGEHEPDPIWQKYFGDEYITQAFVLAHQSDPTAKLFLNEWGMEPICPRSDAIYKFVQTSIAGNIPIHGIGIQMHIALGRNKFLEDVPDMDSLYKNLKRFSDLGLEIHITEMDVSVQSFIGSEEEKTDAQAKVYTDLFSVFQRVPNLKAIIQWGASDKQSWIPIYTGQTDSPLLFDGNYQPKPFIKNIIS